MASEAPIKRSEILVVEDSSSDSHLLLLLLQKSQFPGSIRLAKDGVEALNYLFDRAKASRQDLPSLVILDLNLPRMDGREFLRKMKQAADLQSIPVLVLTTSDTREDRVAATQMGADGFFMKPSGIVEFKDLVRRLMVVEFPRLGVSC